MTKHKENDILISNNGTKKKVLGVCGQVYFMSSAYSFDDVDSYFSEAELDKVGFRLLEEEFNPKEGDVYYFPSINGDCSILSMWENDKNDIRRKAIFGIYRTKEESDAKLKKILNAISILN